MKENKALVSYYAALKMDPITVEDIYKKELK
jgi:hypothetical protein